MVNPSNKKSKNNTFKFVINHPLFFTLILILLTTGMVLFLFHNDDYDYLFFKTVNARKEYVIDAETVCRKKIEGVDDFIRRKSDYYYKYDSWKTDLDVQVEKIWDRNAKEIAVVLNSELKTMIKDFKQDMDKFCNEWGNIKSTIECSDAEQAEEALKNLKAGQSVSALMSQAKTIEDKIDQIIKVINTQGSVPVDY